MKRRRAKCPECGAVFPVKAEGSVLGVACDVFPRHTNPPHPEMCSGSRWIVEQEDYVNEGP